LPYPGFAGFDSAELLTRKQVYQDNRDFGPAFGLAWSPSMRSGWLRKLFGEGKTVLRGGYQISYDAPFTQLIFLGPATTTPNAVSTSGPDVPSTGRGLAEWFEQLPTVARASSVADNRIAIDPNFR